MKKKIYSILVSLTFILSSSAQINSITHNGNVVTYQNVSYQFGEAYDCIFEYTNNYSDSIVVQAKREITCRDQVSSDYYYIYSDQNLGYGAAPTGDFQNIGSYFNLAPNEALSVELLEATFGDLTDGAQRFVLSFQDTTNNTIDSVIVNATLGSGQCGTLNINYNEIEVSSLEFYPNPVKDYLHVSFNSIISNAVIRIYNIDGRVVKMINGFKEVLNVSDLKMGVYFLVLSIGNEEIARKKIIKN